VPRTHRAGCLRRGGPAGPGRAAGRGGDRPGRRGASTRRGCHGAGYRAGDRGGARGAAGGRRPARGRDAAGQLGEARRARRASAAVHDATAAPIVVQDYPVVSGVAISTNALVAAVEAPPFAAAVKAEASPTRAADLPRRLPLVEHRAQRVPRDGGAPAAATPRRRCASFARQRLPAVRRSHRGRRIPARRRTVRVGAARAGRDCPYLTDRQLLPVRAPRQRPRGSRSLADRGTMAGA
jgi:hypothetical protein